MKYVKLYEQWTQVLERMGVPDAVNKYAPVLTTELVKHVKEFLDRGVKGPVQMQFDVPGDTLGSVESFPINRVRVKFEMEPSMDMSIDFLMKSLLGNDNSDNGEPSGTKDINLHGAFDGDEFKLRDGKADVTILIDGKMGLNAFKELLSGGINKDFENMIRNYFQHEMTHAYEEYNRSKGKLHTAMHDTKDFIYDVVANDIGSNGTLPRMISNLLYNIYTAAAYEVRARVSQAADSIRDVKEPHDREEALKKTDMWKIMTDLQNYDAQKVYDGLIKDIILQTDRNKAEAVAIIDHIMKGISSNYIVANNQMVQQIKDDHGFELTDQQADMLAKLVFNHGKEFEKVGKMDGLHFLKFWEKRFHQAAAKMKYKLERLTTYNL